jgi:CheY-like chemotaxis protein
VIDDEPVVQRVARRTLEQLGCIVSVLADGRDALSLLASEKGDFDLILMDVGLPGLAAQHLAEEIRRTKPGVRVLASSGYTESEGRRRLKGLEITGFIQKPYTAAQLKNAVQKALSHA